MWNSRHNSSKSEQYGLTRDPLSGFPEPEKSHPQRLTGCASPLRWLRRSALGNHKSKEGKGGRGQQRRKQRRGNRLELQEMKRNPPGFCSNCLQRVLPGHGGPSAVSPRSAGGQPVVRPRSVGGQPAVSRWSAGGQSAVSPRSLSCPSSRPRSGPAGPGKALRTTGRLSGRPGGSAG